MPILRPETRGLLEAQDTRSSWSLVQLCPVGTQRWRSPGDVGGLQSNLSEQADCTGTAQEINRTLKCKGDS